MEPTLRLRIGFRTGSWLFPNAAVFIIRVKAGLAADIVLQAEKLRDVLRVAGQGIIADRLVCEIS